MSPSNSTHTIPTLTQRIELPAGATPPAHDDLPVLTERVQDAPIRAHVLNSGSLAQEHVPNPTHQASGLESAYDARAGLEPATASPPLTAPWGVQDAQPDAASVAPPAPVPPESTGTTATRPASAEQALSAVLRAALQSELENAVHHAVDEAVTGIYARLDAELPAIIHRALQRVRSG